MITTCKEYGGIILLVLNMNTKPEIPVCDWYFIDFCKVKNWEFGGVWRQCKMRDETPQGILFKSLTSLQVHCFSFSTK